MRIIEPSVEIMTEINNDLLIKNLEKFGRVCYKSENSITDDSAYKFIRMLIKNGHESVLEHEKITVKIVCDRGVSHEIVRHRIASYSQESTRYCNYCNDKFGNELTVIRPCFWQTNQEQYAIWQDSIRVLEDNYNRLIALGAKPEEARSILPNSLKTEIVVTMNLREMRYFLRLRTAPNAHPQMRQVAIMLLKILKDKLPVIFEDILV